MRRRAALAGAAFALGALGACGGKIDRSGLYATSEGAPSHGDPSQNVGGSSGTSGPSGRRGVSLDELASAVASAYCGAISACCEGASLPAIDLAACQSYAADLVKSHVRRPRGATPDDVAVCAAAVRARAALCPAEDAPWPNYGGSTPSLFLPTPVYRACARLIRADASEAAPACDEAAAGSSSSSSSGGEGGGGGAGGGPSDPSGACPDGTTCAVDTCLSIGLEGEACPSLQCVDTQACSPDGLCAPRAPGGPGAPCSSAGCDPGLVCASGACAPAREHPEIGYSERVSPYSIRPETCRRFDYL